jgi:phage FluMu gp28-like protein
MLAENATPPDATVRALRSALPAAEWSAVQAWLSCFYPFQLRWLLDWNRWGILAKSRQIGGSHTFAAAAVLWALLGETTSIVSKGQRESDEVLEKCVKHREVLRRVKSRLAGGPKPTTTEVEFSTGGKIVSLPASSGGRGFSCNVILDEFAYHDDPDAVWDAASAATLLGYRFRVLSTPHGVGNLYSDLWHDPKAHAGYSRHAVTIDEARADGYPVDEDACWKLAHGDARLFDQLFRCKFLDGAAQYISGAMIEAALVDDTYCYEGEVYAGLDIGRTNDLTALVVVRVDAMGVGWVQDVQEKKRTETKDLVELAALALHTYGARRLCVDATGMGAFPAADLQKIYGKQRVEPVVFTPNVKEDLATTMYQRFADRQLRLPRRNTELRDDVAAIRRVITSAGNVRYDAPVTERGHADRAWALALALHGYRKPPNVRHEIGPGAGDYEVT